jgi:hypothetical protein
MMITTEFSTLFDWVRNGMLPWWKAGAYPEGGGSNPPPPEIIPKFLQIRAEFPVPWKIHPKNLIRIRVSPICKLGGIPD